MILLLLLLLPAVASAQSISVLPRYENGPVVVSVENGPGNPMDWVTLTPNGAADNAYVNWFYLNGSKTAPGSGQASSSVTFPVPAVGTYTARFFANNSLAVKLATSVPFTVSGSAIPPPNQTPVPGRIVFDGDSITASANITGAQNWTAIVASRLGYTSSVNLADNGKYASDVLANAAAISGQTCVIMIGTNNMVGSVLSGVTAEDSRASYLFTMRQLVAAVKPQCGRVVIVSPPLSMSARETLRYPLFIDGLRLICAEQAVVFLDLFHYMADLSAVASDAVVQSWYSDWRHLTAAGHAVIGEFVSRSLAVTP